jgi:hypothetical protein
MTRFLKVAFSMHLPGSGQDVWALIAVVSLSPVATPRCGRRLQPRTGFEFTHGFASSMTPAVATNTYGVESAIEVPMLPDRADFSHYKRSDSGRTAPGRKGRAI